MDKTPNFLVFMVDQLSGPLFPDGPADWLHTPVLSRLASESVRFSNTYTPFPQCASARAAFMSGQLASRTRVFDNAAEFASDIPTFAHHLRLAGYRTCLSGKMHFVGPDQLHGFEERLTTDIYPADFGWTPDYRRPDERVDWWYHNLGSVSSAGIAETTHQMEYDDEVAYHATRKIYELASRQSDRPWMLTVSFTHPHDPYVCRRKYWDLYEDCGHLLPRTGPISFEDQDPHSQRILESSDWQSHPITDLDVRRSRQAYFGNISYIDECIGGIIAALKGIRQDDRTVIIFLADHGDMLGERGLWFKMCMFEWSARVPLMIRAPHHSERCVSHPVSIIDVAPTICELAGISMDEIQPWTDGRSLVGDMAGAGRETRPVFMEYTAEASRSPVAAVRSGAWKYIICRDDPAMLFDLESDPDEHNNRAGDPSCAREEKNLSDLADSQWDLEALDKAVRQSQAQRRLVYAALRNGHYFPWDYQPLQKASERYMRNHMDLCELEESQRFPKGE